MTTNLTLPLSHFPTEGMGLLNSELEPVLLEVALIRYCVTAMREATIIKMTRKENYFRGLESLTKIQAKILQLSIVLSWKKTHTQLWSLELSSSVLLCHSQSILVHKEK